TVELFIPKVDTFPRRMAERISFVVKNHKITVLTEFKLAGKPPRTIALFITDELSLHFFLRFFQRDDAGVHRLWLRFDEFNGQFHRTFQAFFRQFIDAVFRVLEAEITDDDSWNDEQKSEHDEQFRFNVHPKSPLDHPLRHATHPCKRLHTSSSHKGF